MPSDTGAISPAIWPVSESWPMAMAPSVAAADSAGAVASVWPESAAGWQAATAMATSSVANKPTAVFMGLSFDSTLTRPTTR